MNSSKQSSELNAPLNESLDDLNECDDEQSENSDITLHSSVVSHTCVEPGESIL